MRDLNENLRKKDREIGKLNKYIDENEKLIKFINDKKIFNKICLSKKLIWKTFGQ